MSILETALTMGVPALSAVFGAVSGSKFVQEGERGVKLRFGRVVRQRNGEPRVIKPGFCFVIPSIEHLHRTHVRTRTFNLPTQDVVLSDRMVFRVGGVVRVKVRDDEKAIYSVLFETNSIAAVVTDYVTSELREVVAASTYEKVLAGDSIIKDVTGRITDQLDQWGLTLISFTLSDCAPTEQTAHTILLGAEAAMRADALISVATKLAGDQNVAAMSPTVAAALIGTPVATSLGGDPSVSLAEGVKVQ